MGKPLYHTIGIRLSPVAEAKLLILTEATRRGKSAVVEMLLQHASVAPSPDIVVSPLLVEEPQDAAAEGSEVAHVG